MAPVSAGRPSCGPGKACTVGKAHCPAWPPSLRRVEPRLAKAPARAASGASAQRPRHWSHRLSLSGHRELELRFFSITACVRAHQLSELNYRAPATTWPSCWTRWGGSRGPLGAAGEGEGSGNADAQAPVAAASRGEARANHFSPSESEQSPLIMSRHCPPARLVLPWASQTRPGN